MDPYQKNKNKLQFKNKQGDGCSGPRSCCRWLALGGRIGHCLVQDRGRKELRREFAAGWMGLGGKLNSNKGED